MSARAYVLLDAIAVKDDPVGYVVMRVDKTAYNMAFPEHELEKI